MNVRLWQTNLAAPNVQDQVALAVYLQLLRPLELYGDRAGVGAGRDQEVVFQLALVPIIDNVDARIDAFVADACVLRNSGLPFGRVVAAEVVGPARKLLHTVDPRRGLAPTSCMRMTTGRRRAQRVDVR